MIKIEHVVTASPEQMEFIIEGMRNPKNSYDKSDSTYGIDNFEIGVNDFNLMKTLSIAGSDHRKYMRMMPIYVRISAPIYFLAEFDTYKIGTVRNSCSFMHKGVSRPFNINDFSLHNRRIYDVLNDFETRVYSLTYPYITNEYRIYTAENGRTYKVFKNGKIVKEAFDYVDNYGSGRKRHFDESDATVYQNSSGYFVIKLSGRNGGHISLHRMVAEVWCDKPEGASQVNHIDGNKGNNSAENLEWVTPSENVQKALEMGLYDNLKSLHKAYKLWKHCVKLIPLEDRLSFKSDADSGMSYKDLSSKYNLTINQVCNLVYSLRHSNNEMLFQECLIWEKIINTLNSLRELYLETKDEQVFQQIRCLLPQGYMQTSNYMLNYEVLANIYHARKNHRLDEWRDFCKWIETLPYSDLITESKKKGGE